MRNLYPPTNQRFVALGIIDSYGNFDYRKDPITKNLLLKAIKFIIVCSSAHDQNMRKHLTYNYL